MTSSANRPVTLDQLIALNEEMAALVRAGVPLDRGLIGASRELPGRSGQLAEEFGRRLEGGENLADIIGGTASLPPVYRAVVQAGLRSGQLAAALQQLAETARRISQLRRMIGASLLYPLAVIALAYVAFVFMAVWLAPVLLGGYEALEVQPSGGLQWLQRLGQTAALWAPWPPLLVAVGLAAAWYRSGRLTSRPGRGMVARLLRANRLATFAELLALLVEQQVPLHEALVLAADASGDRTLQRSAGQLAQRLQQGQVRGLAEQKLAGLPSLLVWLVVGANGSGELGRALRGLADGYRQRVDRTCDWLLSYLPLIVSVGIGGTAVAVMANIVLGNWFQLLARFG